MMQSNAGVHDSVQSSALFCPTCGTLLLCSLLKEKPLRCITMYERLKKRIEEGRCVDCIGLPKR